MKTLYDIAQDTLDMYIDYYAGARTIIVGAMTDAQIERFKPGRKFTSILSNHTWRIDSTNITDEFIYITDENGYSSQMFIESFDVYHYFLDELPTGWSPEWSTFERPEVIKCECGADKYYGLNGGPHSTWCRKYKKETT